MIRSRDEIIIDLGLAEYRVGFAAMDPVVARMAIGKMVKPHESEGRSRQAEPEVSPDRGSAKAQPLAEKRAPGGSGAQPQWLPDWRQQTQAGLHTRSGHHTQP